MLKKVVNITLAILIASVRLVHLITRPWRTVAWRAVLGITWRAVGHVLARLTCASAKTEHEDEHEWDSHGYLAAP